jgi:hypothetical protein
MTRLRTVLRHCGPQRTTEAEPETEPDNEPQSQDSGQTQQLAQRGSTVKDISPPHRDEGMNTAEYAVGTLAAVAFAGLLLKVLTSDAVRNALASIVQRALQ